MGGLSGDKRGVSKYYGGSQGRQGRAVRLVGQIRERESGSERGQKTYTNEREYALDVEGQGMVRRVVDALVVVAFLRGLIFET